MGAEYKTYYSEIPKEIKELRDADGKKILGNKGELIQSLENSRLIIIFYSIFNN